MACGGSGGCDNCPSKGACGSSKPAPEQVPEKAEGHVPEGANTGCVGADSEAAGVAPGCAGCPNRELCASAPKGPDPNVMQIEERMENIGEKILILSGKGGVGKSTFASQLSRYLAGKKKEVGLLDIDITGPSIPAVMGVEDEVVHQSAVGLSPVMVEDNLAVMSIGFLLKDTSTAVIWRGPKKNGLIMQFLRDVDWQALDYLVVDTPPGTGDEHISMAQYLKACHPGAVLITTPQDVALNDVRKEVSFCRKVGIPILGIVENMSGFVCPSCSHESHIFPQKPGGGGEGLATEVGVPFLGRVPLDPRLARAMDLGQEFLSSNAINDPNMPGHAIKALTAVFEKIVEESAKLALSRKAMHQA
eukprot:TRINITY_DN8484_c0_g1_i1.p1 TRINITY_DN8484_c0_g1~~TRINITY_DN8484_c0_g1_i1.p1  ORF type:complete len:371 (+),score=115.17 TRINITY_DN8484_c0_g1_i1:33-1115(+)